MKVDGSSPYVGGISALGQDGYKNDDVQESSSSPVQRDMRGDELLKKAQGEEVSQDELLGMLERVNQYAAIQQVNLRLQVDEDTNLFVVKVVDQESGELIRQIPSEDAIALAKNIDGALQQFFSSDSDPVLSFISDEA